MTATSRTWSLVAPSILAMALGACAQSDPKDRVRGQTDFVSAPPAGGGAQADRNTTGEYQPPATPGANPARAVEETDLYRLDGDRLYFLNAYRGLMVFDVSDVDHPRLLGRSPIFGSPVEMLVRDGIATIVVADWFGTMDDGTPFHGSIVRGLDATDPTHIRVLGEARLGGWVRDTRVVGEVLYAVSEDYGWYYGWDVGGVAVAPFGGGSASQPSVLVSSVSFAGGVIEQKSQLAYQGWGGIFHVTPEAILLAHDAGTAAPRTELLYLDISDPQGTIVQRGAITVRGRAQGWGADNGRWNVDFADGRTAHVLGCAGGSWCDGTGYVLATADFSTPEQPVLRSELDIPSMGWGIAARFDGDRLYLSPDSYTPLAGGLTPFQIYDLSDPAAPRLAGGLQIPGTVWNILLAPEDRIFALGNEWTDTSGLVSLKYIDATDAASPALIGTATFGQGWAWTPAAGTFKAFTFDAARGLVVLPFSGWDTTSFRYNNGLQLIEVSPNSIRAAGAARTKGWVERGIFVGARLVALSDTALSVIDFADRDHPQVTAELTLARNVISARAAGDWLTVVSSDWWDNDLSSSEVRVLPVASAEELTDTSAASAVSVAGVNARVFRNGDLAYVVTSVRVPASCATGGAPQRLEGDVATPACWGRAEQVQVVDVSGGTAVLRGQVQLPLDRWGYGYGWGWYWFDWYNGAEVVQVGSDALAFRRWEPIYDAGGYYLDSNSALLVVDLSNPDQPALASTLITTEPNSWWGNLRVLGDTLYTTHYEWVERTSNASDQWTVRYYVDPVDLSDRAHPVVRASVNVPGLLVGGSASDPALLYFMDYRWDSGAPMNELAVARLDGDVAELLSSTTLDGWVGSTFVRDQKAYMTVQQYSEVDGGHATRTLHAVDLADPYAPVDRVASPRQGWGWLMGVEGDRAIVSSGWGDLGLDIYTLAEGQAPVFSQFVRARGWWASDLSRDGDTLYVASGYWGVQRVSLAP